MIMITDSMVFFFDPFPYEIAKTFKPIRLISELLKLFQLKGCLFTV